MEKEEKSFDLTRVHETNLKMLKEIDRICRKYKIRYSLDSGTLLGAIRHGGFIPWDDDVDVVFTRSNYEAFAKVARRELPDGMSFVEPNEYHGGKAFYDFVSRVLYEKSQKFEESDKMEFYDDKISKLCVDLFVADDLPDGKLAKLLTKLSHCIIYGLALGHRYKINYSDYQGVMKATVFVLSGIGRLIPFSVTYRVWKSLCRKDKKKNTHLYFYSTYAPNYFHVEMEKSDMDKVADTAFDGATLMIMEGWDAYLKQVYGDYMTLPPEEKRIPEHSDMEIKIYG
jgi:lipopolysaccharide cholinephosphotransferase